MLREDDVTVLETITGLDTSFDSTCSGPEPLSASIPDAVMLPREEEEEPSDAIMCYDGVQQVSKPAAKSFVEMLRAGLRKRTLGSSSSRAAPSLDDDDDDFVAPRTILDDDDLVAPEPPTKVRKVGAEGRPVAKPYDWSPEETAIQRCTVNNVVQPAYIKLLKHQVVAVRKLYGILSGESDYAVMRADPGSGKTFMASALTMDLNMDIFLFGPLVVLTDAFMKLGCVKWHMNYEALQTKGTDLIRTGEGGRKYYITANGFLYRVHYTVVVRNAKGEDVVKEVVEFVPTPAGEEFVRSRRMLVVMDEFQALKNEDTYRGGAFHALMALFRQNPDNRFLFMSATIFARKELVVPFFRNMGVVTQPVFAKKIKHASMEQCFAGYIELYNYCHRLDPEKMRQLDDNGRRIARFAPHSKLTVKVAKDRAFRLLLEVVKPKLFADLPPLQLTRPVNRNLFFYKMGSDDELKQLQDGVDTMNSALSRMRARDNAAALSLYTKGLKQCELAKLPAVCRDVIERLSKTTNDKYIIAYNFVTEGRPIVNELLGRHGVLFLDGKTPKAERQRVINLFNEKNTNHRVLAMTTATGGVGVSFHDERDATLWYDQPTFPRTMFIFPKPSFEEMRQASGRIIRCGANSSMTVNIVCAVEVPSEMAFLKSMSRRFAIHNLLAMGDLMPVADLPIPKWTKMGYDSEGRIVEYGPEWFDADAIIHLPSLEAVEEEKDEVEDAKDEVADGGSPAESIDDDDDDSVIDVDAIEDIDDE